MPPRDHRKADLTINGGNPIHGAFVWWDGQTVRAQDPNGISLGEIEVPADGDGKRLIKQVDGKTVEYGDFAGTSWVVYDRGCGCGS